jgi:hypothetical protein
VRIDDGRLVGKVLRVARQGFANVHGLFGQGVRSQELGDTCQMMSNTFSLNRVHAI